MTTIVAPRSIRMGNGPVLQVSGGSSFDVALPRGRSVGVGPAAEHVSSHTLSFARLVLGSVVIYAHGPVTSSPSVDTAFRA